MVYKLNGKLITCNLELLFCGEFCGNVEILIEVKHLYLTIGDSSLWYCILANHGYL
jgi:hypothetical protein